MSTTQSTLGAIESSQSLGWVDQQIGLDAIREFSLNSIIDATLAVYRDGLAQRNGG